MSIMPPASQDNTLAPIVWHLKPETKTRRYKRDDFGYGGTYVYTFLDADLTPLYVGITGNPVERWRRHAQRQPWWPDVAHIEFEEVWKNSDALARERQLISVLRPLHNIRSAAPRG